MRQLSVTTAIDATPTVVWDVLIDTAAYAAWNPFIPEVLGALEPGQRLRVRITPPGGKGMTFRPVVTTVVPGRDLAWLGRVGLPGIFDGAHSFAVRPRPGGGTEFTHSEVFRGLLVPVMGAALRRTEAGFAAMNDALRDRAEELASRPSSAGGVR
ncbi:SRPBCC family protein [Blastococcus sp. SYSU DS0973]